MRAGEPRRDVACKKGICDCFLLILVHPDLAWVLGFAYSLAVSQGIDVWYYIRSIDDGTVVSRV